MEEILQFLELGARVDLKSVALENILGLTASNDGVALLDAVSDHLLRLLGTLALEDKSEPLRKDAVMALINLSAYKDMAKKMTDEKLVMKLWSMIKDDVQPSADPACMVLSNLSIDKTNCDKIYKILKENGVTLEKIVDFLCRDPPKEEKNAKLHYLGPFVSNLSQLSEVRQELLKDSCKLMARLLPFSEYSASSVRRGGVIGAIRNCCFDTKVHEMLLTEMDLLPRLLLPLAGPAPDSFDESDIEKLPIDLQYLDEDKKIEDDPDIRLLLLEALLQLCATKKCREIIRDQNAYLILRELHKIEAEDNVKLACENVVDILIKKEEEINLDNYKSVEVPEDVQKKFEEL